MKINVDDRDVFDLSGPTHLADRHPVDREVKQALMAALVQAVYVAENDRQQGRQGVYALAPRWWSALGYEPVRFICEEQLENIFGAVFKRKESNLGEEEPFAPMMVVAFRGTALRGDALQNDIMADFYLFLEQLHTTSRFSVALEAIRLAVQQVGLQHVCVAGHSLGAALALLAGRTFASEGVLLDMHLFNPPFASPPIERIRSQRWQLALQVLCMTSVAGLAGLLLDSNSRQVAFRAFLSLKHWLPHLYVNANDPVCCSYIGYFSSREFVHKIGAGALAQLAAPLSLQGTILQYFFGERKASHLIPCAHLHVVEKSSRKLVKAHGLHQWWSPKFKIHYRKVNFEGELFVEDVNANHQS